MKKTEITFVRDMESPKISSMLQSDIMGKFTPRNANGTNRQTHILET